jgi:hypothetical protein
MFWKKKDKLSDLEQSIIDAIKKAKLPDWKLLEIDDYLNDRRFMSRYHGGAKKEKKRRPAFSNHAEGC